VLDPLAEIAPDVIHPLKKSPSTITATIAQAAVRFSIAGLPPAEAESLIEELKRHYPDVLFTVGN